MKWFKLVAVSIIVTAGVLYAGMYFYIVSFGASLLEKKLSATFDRPAKVARLVPVLPLSIRAFDVEVPGLFLVREVYASGGMLDIFKKRFTVSDLRLRGVEAKVEKPFKNIPTDAAKEISEAPAQGIAARHAPNISPTTIHSGVFLYPDFIVRKLQISDSVFHFVDKRFSPGELQYRVEKLHIAIENLNFPVTSSTITSFSMKGVIPWQDKSAEGSLDVVGWVNFYKKDMQATVKLEGIDGVALTPYYAKWVDIGKANIQKARLNFSSTIQGLNNDISAACHLELAELAFKPRDTEEKQSKEERMASLVLGFFKGGSSGKIELNFTLKTKMDSPEFGFGHVRLAVEEKLAQARAARRFNPEGIFLLPSKLIEGTVRGAADISKAVIGGTFGIGKEFKNAVEGAFSREPVPHQATTLNTASP